MNSALFGETLSTTDDSLSLPLPTAVPLVPSARHSDAMEQLDLLKVMSDGEPPDARLLLLEAQVTAAKLASASVTHGGRSSSKKNSVASVLRLLDKAAKAHRRKLRAAAKGDTIASVAPTLGDACRRLDLESRVQASLSFGERLFVASDPALSMEIAELYIGLCGDTAGASAMLSSPSSGQGAKSSGARSGSGGDKGDGLERALVLLKEAAGLCPSLVEAHLLAATATLARDPDHPEACLKIPRRCLRFAPSFAPAHLLTAKVALERCGNLRLAQQSLDHALGLDFSIRQNPAYHVARAQLLSAKGSPDLALKQLEEARGTLRGLDDGARSSSISRMGSGSSMSRGSMVAEAALQVKGHIAEH